MDIESEPSNPYGGGFQSNNNFTNLAPFKYNPPITTTQNLQNPQNAFNPYQMGSKNFYSSKKEVDKK